MTATTSHALEDILDGYTVRHGTQFWSTCGCGWVSGFKDFAREAQEAHREHAEVQS